jgi:acyl-CoA synthetase (NDP forming)
MWADKLKVFFEPGSVAVIGASSSPTKLGYAVLKNLAEGGYMQRRIVNPTSPTGRHDSWQRSQRPSRASE